MTFDMKGCKPGDKLLSVHGTILEYVEYKSTDHFPHIVKYPNGSLGSRTDKGYVFNNRRLPEDEDIVGLYVE